MATESPREPKQVPVDYFSYRYGPGGLLLVAQHAVVVPFLAVGFGVLALGVWKLSEEFGSFAILAVPVFVAIVTTWVHTCFRYGAIWYKLTFDPVTGTIWRQCSVAAGRLATKSKPWLRAEEIDEVEWHRSPDERTRKELIRLHLVDERVVDLPPCSDGNVDVLGLANRVALFAGAKLTTIDGAGARQELST